MCLASDTYLLFKVDVHQCLYNIFLQYVVTNCLIFLFSSCVEHDLAFRRECKHGRQLRLNCFNKIVTITCVHCKRKKNHVMCTDRVNRGCPRGHMLVTHWAKKSPVESKRASVTYLELRTAADRGTRKAHEL